MAKQLSFIFLGMFIFCTILGIFFVSRKKYDSFFVEMLSPSLVDLEKTESEKETKVRKLLYSKGVLKIIISLVLLYLVPSFSGGIVFLFATFFYFNDNFFSKKIDDIIRSWVR